MAKTCVYSSCTKDAKGNSNYCQKHGAFKKIMQGYRMKHGFFALITCVVVACGGSKSPTEPSQNNAPTVSITSGPSGAVDTSTVTFTWNGQDTDGTVQGYEYKMDGVAGSTSNTSRTFSNLSESSHTFEVRAQDDDGAYSSWASRSFSVDIAFSVQGTLLDARTFNPVGGVNVSVTDGIGTGQSTVTDFHGEFVLREVEGTITFRAQANGYVELAHTLDVTTDMNVQLELEALTGPTIPCGEGPNIGNRVLPMFGPPFTGSHTLRNYFDHDGPGLEPNGRVLNTCGAEVVRYDGHGAYDFNLPLGTPVIAVADGVVNAAGETLPFWCESLQRMVTAIIAGLTHPPMQGEQFQTGYAHLSRVDVEEGQFVSRGQQIGLSGSSGCSAGIEHLHFEVERLTGTNSGQGATVDPYGWEGDGADPWSEHPDGARSFWLWLPGQAPPLRCGPLCR